MTRRLALVLAVGAISLFSTWAQAQELLTNGGIELVSEEFAGRDAVPPGWQMQEGPLVPELPEGTPPPTAPLVLAPYDGDYNGGGVTSLPCGLNGCGAVDAADYTVWRDHLGTTFPMPNRYHDITTPIGQFDYTVWKQNFGNPLPISLAEPGNFSHLLWEGDWHMWFQPYNSTRTENAEAIANNFAHLTQTVAGTPGLEYTMTGYALFEDYFPGGVVNLNAANPDGTGTGAPFDDGPLSPTDTFFALEFLDSMGAVLPGSVVVELKADGQTSDTFWRQHTLVGVAPAGTANVRVRASMINGVENPLPSPQAFQMSFFVDDFHLTAGPAGAGAGAVPEPTSWLLGMIALAALSASRNRSSARG
jgi:hypothetical protein